MTNELAIQKPQKLSVWESVPLDEIKSNCAPTLTSAEFKYFVEMGKACDLNPFLREIWSIKYDQKSPASVFIGRDGYRKAAQRHPDYDFHHVDAVYSKDIFKVLNGQVHHEYTLQDRGNLVGAYCFVKRKNSSREMYTYVDFKEYNTGRKNWATMPSTMIKKVAESQCLRAAFQELFSGTHDESERFVIEANMNEKDASRSLKDAIKKNTTDYISNGEIVDANNNIYGQDVDVSPEPSAISLYENAIMDNPNTSGEIKAYAQMADIGAEEDNSKKLNKNDFVSDKTIEILNEVMYENSIPDERLQKALKKFNVLTINELSEENALKIIEVFGS